MLTAGRFLLLQNRHTVHPVHKTMQKIFKKRSLQLTSEHLEIIFNKVSEQIRASLELDYEVC